MLADDNPSPIDSYVPNQPRLPLTIDELEDVVEDEEASATIGHKLEGLSVVHRSLFLIDLDNPSQRHTPLAL